MSYRILCERRKVISSGSDPQGLSTLFSDFLDTNDDESSESSYEFFILTSTVVEEREEYERCTSRDTLCDGP